MLLKLEKRFNAIECLKYDYFQSIEKKYVMN